MPSQVSEFLAISEGALYDCYEIGSIGVFKQEPQDVEFWLRMAKEISGSVLEIGCGTGRITTHLDLNNIKVTGVDISEEMLRVARKKSPRVSWILSDMRNLSINNLFDLIILPYNCFLMLLNLEDAESCLTSLRRHLQIGGKLVIDIVNPSPEYLFPLLYNEKIHVSSIFEHPANKRVIVATRQRQYNPDTQLLCLNRSFRFLNCKEVVGDTEFFRIYFPQEINMLLRFCKFTVDSKYGNYDFEPFSPGSPQQLLVCSSAAKD